ncbi:hypothetical protein M569_04260 [Genlisea aurea]|uniref:Uncharacterized protein n=1 Tax=Genlisea aurea TaxID=192259 RepID=S8CZJ7_9LAMI|nr:hypothetical protein M569_04260 [Genlisea aurea]
MSAAAYGSLLSLTQVLDRLHHLHSHGGIVLDTDQLHSLRQLLHSLLHFIQETHPTSETQSLLIGKISILAVEAEVILDQEIIHQHRGYCASGVLLSLDQVILKLASIYQALKTSIGSSTAEEVDVDYYSTSNFDDSATDTASSSSSSSAMVGYEDRMSWVMDKLTDGETNLQVIPIVGMGGIGKTTLARSVYDHENMESRFDRRMWCTMSQKCDVHQILQSLLEIKSNKTVRELGCELHHKLYRRRYLIVVDDVWSFEAWESLKIHLPDNMNGSRVIVTTRNKEVADSSCTCGDSCALALLESNKCWDLLKNKIFGESDCPGSFERIGKKIAKSCRGLPLSLVTIAGLLSKPENMNIRYWGSVARNVSGVASSTDEQNCLKVLSLSYHFLPIHLKPCFLYLSNFDEDEKINAKELIRRWIAEGFLKSVAGRTMEDVGEEYLKDLIDRNLVLILKKNLADEIKECGVHDLVRELCIKESGMENFFYTPRFNRFKGKEDKKCLICSRYEAKDVEKEDGMIRLLKVGNMDSSTFTDILVCKECEIKCPFLERSTLVTFFSRKVFTTSRFIDSCPFHIIQFSEEFESPLLLHFWNLQFLRFRVPHRRNVPVGYATFLAKIWEMPQLRYLDIGQIHLPDPTGSSSSSSIILSELQELFVWDQMLSDELIRRIPNLKKLNLTITKHSFDYSLHLLESFTQLQSLTLSGGCNLLKCGIKFPDCLKKLSLRDVIMSWDETMPVIGSLPNLQVLKLMNVWDEKTAEWNMEEGGFSSLKVLVILNGGLRTWNAESQHLPALEKLMIKDDHAGMEIPSDIGNIATLNSILVSRDCAHTAYSSVKRILREQFDYGNEILRIFDDGRRLQMDTDSTEILLSDGRVVKECNEDDDDDGTNPFVDARGDNIDMNPDDEILQIFDPQLLSDPDDESSQIFG